MSKKIGNKELAIILIALLAIYGISRYIAKRKGENTFHTSAIPTIDSAKVSTVYIFSKLKKDHPIILEKKNNTWTVTQDGFTANADQASPKYMIQQLKMISPDRLASNDVKQWSDFQVTDTTGTRIVALNGKDTLIDVIVGKFGFMPEQRKGISYVRINHQVEVYGVEGFLSMNISQDFDSWRDRKIIPMDYRSWTKLTFTYPADSGFSVSQDVNAYWAYADDSRTDSVGADDVVKSIAQQNYGSFVNKFDTNAQPAQFSLKIDMKGGSVLVKAYPAADTVNKYIITSSMQPGAYFSGAKSSLFSKIFVAKKAFMHHPAAPADKPGTPAMAPKPVKMAGKR
jgi:hypothetical protein